MAVRRVEKWDDLWVVDWELRWVVEWAREWDEQMEYNWVYSRVVVMDHCWVAY